MMPPNLFPRGTNLIITIQKIINLILVAFHGFTGAFTATSIICAYQEIAEDLGVSLQSISYLTSIQIAILGGAPLLWKTLSHRFGRRPIFLLSLLFTCVCNIGCAKSPTYSSMAVCRALAGFFVCPAIAIGTAVVMETFFKHERGRFMGVWTLLVSLGVPLGPLIFGFVAQRVEYRWIYWILAIVRSTPPQCMIRKHSKVYCTHFTDSMQFSHIDQRSPIHSLRLLRS